MHAKSTVAMANTPILCLLLGKMYCCHGNYAHIHTVAMVHENSVLLCKEYCYHGNYTNALLVAI